MKVGRFFSAERRWRVWPIGHSQGVTVYGYKTRWPRLVVEFRIPVPPIGFGRRFDQAGDSLSPAELVDPSPLVLAAGALLAKHSGCRCSACRLALADIRATDGATTEGDKESHA